MYDITKNIMDSLSELNHEIYKLVKLEADKWGLTYVQLKTIHRIYTYPGIGLSGLAEKLRLTSSTVSGIIERLVHSGIVDRIIPLEDRRSVSLHLTKKGEELIESILKSTDITMTRLNGLSEIPQEELEQLFRLHKLILSKLKIEKE